MARVTVWSERVEPNASGFRDCTYSSGLMGMVWAGFTDFPKGIYTVEEREALERSDDQPNETGASLADLKTAIKRRYGKDRSVRGAADLDADLDKKGVGWVVQGKLSNLPSGHILRRHQPGFTGGHAIFVVNLGDGYYWWGDPLAPMKYHGDLASKSEVMKYASGLGAHMAFKDDEFKPVVAPAPEPAPTGITQAQYDAVVAERDQAKATSQTNWDLYQAAEAKITAAKAALG